MVIDIYSFKLSAPCHSVRMTAKEIGIDLNIIEMNTGKNEQYDPEFLKLNPIHTIPTIVDNGFVLWESRAIMQYLCNTYAPNSALYPSDPKKRAIVDRWLNFDISYYSSIKQGLMVKAYLGVEPKPEKVSALDNNLKLLDQLIGDNKYITGEHLTIADLTILSNTCEVIECGYDLTQLPNFKRWFEGLKRELPYFQEVLMASTKEEVNEWAQNKEYLNRMLNN